MKALHPLLALSVLALGLAPAFAHNHASQEPASQEPASHEHATHAPNVQAAPAPSASRWTADEPLQRGMLGVRTAVEGLGHHEHGHLDPAQVGVLTQKIEGHVRDIVAECKLPPQADAALHGIIAKLLRGTASLKSDPSQTQVVATMRDAIAEYDRLFVEAPATQAQTGNRAR